MLRTKIGLAAMLLATSLGAEAYTLVVTADSAIIPEATARQTVDSLAVQTGHRIPETPSIKVVVLTRAKERKQQPGQYLYYHRVQLTKVFNAGPPYPFAGWLPIKNAEFYGVGDAQEVRERFDTLVRNFFFELKGVDPNTMAPN